MKQAKEKEMMNTPSREELLSFLIEEGENYIGHSPFTLNTEPLVQFIVREMEESKEEWGLTIDISTMERIAQDLIDGNFIDEYEVAQRMYNVSDSNG